MPSHRTLWRIAKTVVVTPVALYLTYTGVSGRELLWETAPKFFEDLSASELGRFGLVAVGVVLLAFAWGPAAYRNAKRSIGPAVGEKGAPIPPIPTGFIGGEGSLLEMEDDSAIEGFEQGIASPGKTTLRDRARVSRHQSPKDSPSEEGS